MSRLIDADNAKIYLSKSAGEQLDRVPTADVQEVKHGKWEYTDLAYTCSECKAVSFNTDYFCHNCGAKMDGKEDNNE